MTVTNVDAFKSSMNKKRKQKNKIVSSLKLRTQISRVPSPMVRRTKKRRSSTSS